MLPGWHHSPPYILTPSILGFESFPFCVDPPAFFEALRHGTWPSAPAGQDSAICRQATPNSRGSMPITRRAQVLCKPAVMHAGRSAQVGPGGGRRAGREQGRGSASHQRCCWQQHWAASQPVEACSSGEATAPSRRCSDCIDKLGRAGPRESSIGCKESAQGAETKGSMPLIHLRRAAR